MHSEIYKRIRDNIIKTWPAWKRKVYNSCFAVSTHAEKLPEDDRTRSTPVWTNYDRLIAMNLDELAFELAVNGCPTIYPKCPAKKDPEGHSNCVKYWLDWLKSPVEEQT